MTGRNCHGLLMGAVSAKATTLIGFWNVRAMYEQDKMVQVIAEMKRFHFHVIFMSSGTSERRWTRSVGMKTGTEETILYSGREDDLHHEGVPIILKKGIEQCYGVESSKQQDHSSTFEGQAGPTRPSYSPRHLPITTITWSTKPSMSSCKRPSRAPTAAGIMPLAWCWAT